MEKNEIKNRILENASNIQYYLNIINNSYNEYELYKLDGAYRLEVWEYGGNYQPKNYILNINKKIFMFLVKDRKLKSGLSNPMARFYGYKAINKGWNYEIKNVGH